MAVTIACPALAFFVQRDIAAIQSIEVGFPAEEYLSVRLEMDQETAPGTSPETARAEFLSRFRATYQDLAQRLGAEPTVAGVTFAERLPRMYHPHRRIEVDDGGEAIPDSVLGYRVSSVQVDVDFFDVLGTPILSGRGFDSGDLESDDGAVIVNQSFVERVLGGRNPIGRRVRYLYFEESGEAWSAGEEPGPWYEIVGVVRDMGMAVNRDPKSAGFYHPVAPDGAYPVHMAVHVRGDAESFATRLRTVARAVDPTLRLNDLGSLDEVQESTLELYAFWFTLTVFVSGVAMFLSMAGIYSVMAFTVSRRTREIGVRVALGADARRLVAAIFARPLGQIGVGAVAGVMMAGVLAYGAMGASFWARGPAVLVAYGALMMGVCMLACIVPSRRALRVEPTEALRADG